MSRAAGLSAHPPCWLPRGAGRGRLLLVEPGGGSGRGGGSASRVRACRGGPRPSPCAHPLLSRPPARARRRTLWERDLIQSELDHLMSDFEGIAQVGAGTAAGCWAARGSSGGPGAGSCRSPPRRAARRRPAAPPSPPPLARATLPHPHAHPSTPPTRPRQAKYRRGMAILSLICNVERTSEILERVFRVFGRERVNVQMMSQGASKTNIALIVSDAEAKVALKALHDEFFNEQQ